MKIETEKTQNYNRVIISKDYRESLSYSLSSYDLPINYIYRLVSSGVTRSVILDTTDTGHYIYASHLKVLTEEELVTIRNKTIAGLLEVVAMLDKISDANFYFGQYYNSLQFEVISEETNTLCSTTCCVVGWMPKYMPQVGIKYQLHINKRVKLVPDYISDNDDPYGDTIHFSDKVMEYLGINNALYSMLFLSESQADLPMYKDNSIILLPNLHDRSNVTEVKVNIITMIDYIRLGYADTGLIHNINF